jgi:acyl-CoA synthetase (AMP-forming)/AMP-acid ligase II
LKLGIYQPTYDLLFLSHSPITKLTHAILLSKTRHHIFTPLLSSLKSFHSLACSQSLLLPILITEQTFLASERRIDNTEWKLNRSDEYLGQHEYVERPRGDLMDSDRVKITRTLNTVRESVTREQLRINATSLALEAIGSYMDGMRERERSEGDMLVEEMIAHQVDSCKNLLLRMEYHEKRVQSQTAVVSPLACMQLS